MGEVDKAGVSTPSPVQSKVAKMLTFGSSHVNSKGEGTKFPSHSFSSIVEMTQSPAVQVAAVVKLGLLQLPSAVQELAEAVHATDPRHSPSV